MSFLAIFFIVVLGLPILFGPIFGAEDRPAFRRPDRKPRRMG